MAKRHSRARTCAIDVSGAAYVEVGPLRDVARAGDASCVCSQEVGILEWCSCCHAAQNDEEDHHNGTGEEDQGNAAQ